MTLDIQPTEAEMQQSVFAVIEDETTVGQIVRRDRMKQTLGNLALVTQSFNSGVSNFAFDVKRGDFEDQSVLMLTKDFVRKKRWDEAEIENRGRALFEIAQNIWIAP